jgi:hypothetical protein
MKTYHNAVDPVGYDIQGDSMQVNLIVIIGFLKQYRCLPPVLLVLN